VTLSFRFRNSNVSPMKRLSSYSPASELNKSLYIIPCLNASRNIAIWPKESFPMIVWCAINNRETKRADALKRLETNSITVLLLIYWSLPLFVSGKTSEETDEIISQSEYLSSLEGLSPVSSQLKYADFWLPESALSENYTGYLHNRAATKFPEYLHQKKYSKCPMKS